MAVQGIHAFLSQELGEILLAEHIDEYLQRPLHVASHLILRAFTDTEELYSAEKDAHQAGDNGYSDDWIELHQHKEMRVVDHHIHHRGDDHTALVDQEFARAAAECVRDAHLSELLRLTYAADEIDQHGQKHKGGTGAGDN